MRTSLRPVFRLSLPPSSAWLFALNCCACDFPISTSRYEVRESTQRLLDAFSDGIDECRAQLEEGCGVHLDNCAKTPGCIAFSECVRSLRNPVAEATCRSQVDSSLEAQWGYELVRACWAERLVVCDVGTDWDCIDNYVPPAAEPRPYLLLSQQVSYVDRGLNGDVIDVAVCGLAPDCSDPLATGRTDTEGRFTLEVPIAEGTAGLTWNGSRLLSGDKIIPSFVELNIPVWHDRVETTRLQTRALVELQQALAEIEYASAIFTQVLDCRSSPAAGIRFVPSDGADAYVDSFGQLGGDVTTGSGAGGVYDFDPAEMVEIVAYREADGAEVARWSGQLPSDKIMYLKLYPPPRYE
jgi:hypothetical protein